jgi:hypothetical protein
MLEDNTPRGEALGPAPDPWDPSSLLPPPVLADLRAEGLPHALPTRAALGIPPEVQPPFFALGPSPEAVALGLPKPPFQLYIVLPQDWPVPRAERAPPWPCIQILDRDTGALLPMLDRDTGAGVATFQVRLGWTWRDGCPLIAEVRWHPAAGETRSIHGLEQLHTAKQLLEARRWFGGMAERLGLGGRPSDSDEAALVEMVGWARKYLQLHPTATIKDIGRAALFEVSGMSGSGLNKRMADKHVTLKRIRARLRELWGVSGRDTAPGEDAD